jgi:hypothetical protein
MSGGDVTDPRTQVPAVRWVLVPLTASYHARHLMSLLLEDPTPAALLGI